MSVMRALRRTFMHQLPVNRVAHCFYCTTERRVSIRKGVPVCNRCTRAHRLRGRVARERSR